jgi:hypothetical protein
MYRALHPSSAKILDQVSNIVAGHRRHWFGWRDDEHTIDVDQASLDRLGFDLESTVAHLCTQRLPRLDSKAIAKSLRHDDSSCPIHGDDEVLWHGRNLP